MEVVRVYEDQGKSASNEDTSTRPAFTQLMQAAATGAFDIVLVHKYDRFSRKIVVLMRSLDELLKAKVRFYSLTEGESQLTTAQGFLQAGMFGLLAEFYQRNLGAEAQKGLRTRAERYGIQNGTIPFGYMRAEGGKHLPPVPNPEEAPIVRELFERYASGEWSFSALARWAHNQGIRPHTRSGSPSRFVDHNAWSIIYNRFYVGYITYRGAELQGAHEPLIDEALWNKVCVVRNARQRTGRVRAQRVKNHWLLGFVAHCASCGLKLRPMTGVNKLRPTASPSFKCRANELQVTCPAKVHSVRMHRVDGLMHELMASFGSISKVMEHVSAAAEERQPNDMVAVVRTRKSLEQRLSRLQELYLDGDIAKDRYTEDKRNIEAQLSELALPSETVNAASVKELEAIAEAWPWTTPEEQARIVRTIFQAVYLDLDERRIVAVRPYVPFLYAVQPAAARLGVEVLLEARPESVASRVG